MTVLTVSAPYLNSTCSMTNWTASSVIVQWSDTTGDSYYTLMVYDGDRLLRSINSSSSQVNITNLSASVWYSFNITGYGADGQRGNTVSCSGTPGMVAIGELKLDGGVQIIR